MHTPNFIYLREIVSEKQKGKKKREKKQSQAVMFMRL